MRKKLLLSIFLLGFTLTMVFPATFTVSGNTEAEISVISPTLLEQPLGAFVDVLIETNTNDYSALVAQINAFNGEVTYEYQYARGLSAKIPSNLLISLKSHPNVKKISADELRYISSDMDMFSFDRQIRSGENIGLDAKAYKTLPLDQDVVTPQTYANPITMHANEIWQKGYAGQDSLVVIIDTGIWPDHFMLQGSVIGGVDLSPDQGTPDEGWDLDYNHWHGSHVAGIVAGHGAIGFAEPYDDPLLVAIEQYAPGTAYLEDGLMWVDLFGMAPLAQLFAIKAFPTTGAAVPESIIISAIEYAINMKENEGYDVDVISMSLGGPTGFDGRDLEDQTVDYATSIGITVVTSTGNEGPASMTTGSPGTANTAISVGAAAHPINTRVYWEYAYGIPGIGYDLFTSEQPEIYAFSSRGPTADGRNKPTVSATGMLVLSAWTPGYGAILGFASGTSMACPAVSGTVALLNSWSETKNKGASPYDYKQAIVRGAEWLKGYDKYDQGAGYLNAWKAFKSLRRDRSLGDKHPGLSKWYSSWASSPKGINTHIYGKGTFSYNVRDLKPSRAKHFYFLATEPTNYIKVEILDVDYGTDPWGMNSFEIYIQSAVRSGYDYYIETANVWGDTVFEIRDFSTIWTGDAVGGVYYQEALIQPGWMKVVVENDWTSYDDISGKIRITVGAEKHYCKHYDRPDETYFGLFETDDYEGFFPIGFGPSGVKLEYWWIRDWTRYPTTDLDMAIAYFDETGGPYYEWYAGGSLRSPEGILLEDSTLTAVYVFLYGYETYSRVEPWMLKVYYLD
ncbi:MAG: S8 family serine peptidase [Candidatus Hodarchaeota archaeon]